MEHIPNDSQASKGLDNLIDEDSEASKGLDNLIDEDSEASKGLDNLIDKDSEASKGLDNLIDEDSEASKGLDNLTDEDSEASTGLDNLTDEDSEASKGLDNLIDEDGNEIDYFDDDDSEDDDEFGYEFLKNLSMNKTPLKHIRDILYAGLRDYFYEFEIAVVSSPRLTNSPYNLEFDGLSGMNILEMNYPMERMTNITPMESGPVRPIRYFTKHQYFTEGRPGIVLEMYAKGRKTNHSIIALMQNTLHRSFSYKMGIGGMLMMLGGQLLQYKPKFFSEATYHHIKCDSEITITGAIVNEPMQIVGHHDGLFMTNIRHMFDLPSEHGNGLFVNDITPRETEYFGYFNIADAVLRW